MLTLENVLEKILQADIHDERDREILANTKGGRTATVMYDAPRTVSKLGRLESYNFANSQVGGDRATLSSVK